MSPHTVRGYISELRFFGDFLSQHIGQHASLNILANLKVTDFRSYLAYRAGKGNSNTTRARALSALKRFYAWLDKQGFLHNPQITLLQSPKKHKTLPKAIEIDNIFQLLSELAQDIKNDDWVSLRNAALFTLLYGTGIRIAEALSLTLKNRPKGDTIVVMGKRSKERMVPVLPIVRKAIDAYLDACPYAVSQSDDLPLFFGERGDVLNPDVARKVIRDLRRGLQLPETITPHAFRHSFATHLLQKGMNLRMIQELLGHASLSSTQIYADLSIEDLKKTYDKAHPRNRSAD